MSEYMDKVVGEFLKYHDLWGGITRLEDVSLDNVEYKRLVKGYQFNIKFRLYNDQDEAMMKGQPFIIVIPFIFDDTFNLVDFDEKDFVSEKLLREIVRCVEEFRDSYIDPTNRGRYIDIDTKEARPQHRLLKSFLNMEVSELLRFNGSAGCILYGDYQIANIRTFTGKDVLDCSYLYTQEQVDWIMSVVGEEISNWSHNHLRSKALEPFYRINLKDLK